jgi:arylsulfatase A-like enzyme
VWHPRLGHGTRPKAFVQPIDFFPTILEAAGVDAPAELQLHGQSLIPWLEDPDASGSRDAILFGEFAQTCNLTDGEYTLFQGVDPSNPPLYSYSLNKSKWSSDDWGPFDGTRRRVGPRNANTAGERNLTRLYHLPADPKQERNLADSAPDALRRLRRLMVEKLQAIDAPPELIVRWGLDKALG